MKKYLLLKFNYLPRSMSLNSSICEFINHRHVVLNETSIDHAALVKAANITSLIFINKKLEISKSAALELISHFDTIKANLLAQNAKGDHEGLIYYANYHDQVYTMYLMGVNEAVGIYVALEHNCLYKLSANKIIVYKLAPTNWSAQTFFVKRLSSRATELQMKLKADLAKCAVRTKQMLVGGTLLADKIVELKKWGRLAPYGKVAAMYATSATFGEIADEFSKACQILGLPYLVGLEVEFGLMNCLIDLVSALRVGKTVTSSEDPLGIRQSLEKVFYDWQLGGSNLHSMELAFKTALDFLNSLTQLEREALLFHLKSKCKKYFVAKANDDPITMWNVYYAKSMDMKSELVQLNLHFRRLAKLIAFKAESSPTLQVSASDLKKMAHQGAHLVSQLNSVFLKDETLTAQALKENVGKFCAEVSSKFNTLNLNQHLN